jgi:hypothetical protein
MVGSLLVRKLLARGASVRAIVHEAKGRDPLARLGVSGHAALAVVTDDVQRVTAHAPRSLEQFARDNAEALRPSRPWSEQPIAP